MCLTYEYFKKRGDIKKEYQDKGRLDLDQFMLDFSITEQQLISSGLFIMRNLKFTTQLYDYELTLEGKKHFIYNSSELFFIKAKIHPGDLYKYILKACENKRNNFKL
jgi:hypothetical protein